MSLSRESATPLDSLNAANLHHVEADHGVVVHDDTVIRLNEAHASHVCCQVEYMLTTLDDFAAIVIHSEIHQVEFVTEDFLLQVDF